MQLRDDGRFHLWLIVRNEGKLAAKSVKIVLINESDSAASLVLGFADFRQETDDRCELPGRLEDRQITVYSSYDERFWGQIRGLPPSLPLPFGQLLRCRVWADGLGEAVDQSLRVTVTR